MPSLNRLSLLFTVHNIFRKNFAKCLDCVYILCYICGNNNKKTNFMKKVTTYNVSGYTMKKNPETWEMERNSFVSKATAFSRLKDIETNEDREFFECEIALQMNCDYFELDGFEVMDYVNNMNEAQFEDRKLGNI